MHSIFYLALGQFIPYQAALEELEPDRVLYLAVHSDVYDLFFSQPFIQKIVQRQAVRLLTYNSSQEEIVT
jgi:XisH protein